MNGANIKHGDTVLLGNKTYIVDRVLYSDEWNGVYDIEFIDTGCNYHHWKQFFDGGCLVRGTKRKLVNLNGVDCTDIFEKYGY